MIFGRPVIHGWLVGIGVIGVKATTLANAQTLKPLNITLTVQ